MWEQNNYFGVPELAPNIQNLADFEMLLTYPRLLLHNANSWGLEFECTWDVEHGAGVLFVDGQIVNAGLAIASSQWIHGKRKVGARGKFAKVKKNATL